MMVACFLVVSGVKGRVVKTEQGFRAEFVTSVVVKVISLKIAPRTRRDMNAKWTRDTKGKVALVGRGIIIINAEDINCGWYEYCVSVDKKKSVF